MKKKIFQRIAAFGLALLCAFVSIPADGVSRVLTVYAEETTEETTEESTEETTEEPTQTADDVYFDVANGVSYYYYGYSDGTAKIYNVTFPSGAVLDFPATVSTYTVTEIDLADIAGYDSRANVSVMTIPENITYIYGQSFRFFDIGTLNYNTNGTNEGQAVDFIFESATISNLNIGANVNYIDDWTFANATFLFSDFTISVKTIGDNAFRGVWTSDCPVRLTLAEGVESIDWCAFSLNHIDVLNYNCNVTQSTWAGDNSIFHYSYIDELNIGSNVSVIADYMFYEAYFQFDELTLDVAVIGEGAFGNIWSEDHKGILTLTENVTYLRPSAFAYNYFETVNYNCSADGESWYDAQAIFYKATIGNLNIGPGVTKIPDFAFFESSFKFHELTLDVERIGEKAFYYLWADEEAGKLTLTERVKHISPSAFGRGNYAEVSYYANAEGESSYNTESIFYKSKIDKLTIGDNVTTVPGWLFYQAVFGFDELTVNIAEINEYAFGGAWAADNPVTLTIGEAVAEIYPKAFCDLVIRDLNYNAGATMPKTANGAFKDSIIHNLDIGDNVETIGTYMFHSTKIRDTDVIIRAKTIEPYAFAYAWTSEYPVNLVIDETVETLGTRAFYKIYINDLRYNAISASTNTSLSGSNAPFNGCTVTALQIGDKVENLRSYTFYNIILTQEDLKIPNSVKYMGNSVFCNTDSFNITNLYIGSGLEEIKPDSFGKALTLTSLYVEALTGNETYHKTSLATATAKNNLPVAENVYIHTNSDFYYYFTSKAANITSYCVEHMKETVGEEYFDSITTQYVTPTYDTCEICNYQTTTYAYEDAHTINFYVDGILYHTAYAKDGGSVEAPEEPTQEGYNFIGWDADLDNITADMTVNAQFEIKTHVHSYETEAEKKEATCVEKGYIISSCSCGDTETKEFETNPNRHIGDTGIRNEKAASCTETGYTGDTYCKSCEAELEKGTDIHAIDHTPGQEVEENRVEPTVETMGFYDAVIYCDICSTELSRVKRDIPMLAPEEPSEPTEPTDPDEPTDPTDPEEPSEPTEPTDPEEPSEPTEPTNPIDPAEPDEPEDSEDKEDEEDNSETPTETEPEEPSETEVETESEAPQPSTETEELEEDEPAPIPIAVPLVAGAGIAGSTGAVYFIYWKRRRKIYGTVLDHSGNTVANAKVYLEGAKVMETLTDENGYFEFRNLKAGDYQFILANELDVMLMEANIHTEEKDKEQIVDILQSSCEVEAERIQKNIALVLTLR